MRKRLFCLFVSAVFFLAGNLLPAREQNGADKVSADNILPGETSADEVRWFRSNASGIALELVPSRLAALRNEYCLSAKSVRPGEIPEILLPYYNNLRAEFEAEAGGDEFPFSIEMRTLYEKGEEFRRQWIFRGGGGVSRLTASGSGGLFGGKTSGEETPSGFIEVRNAGGSVEREFHFEKDLSEWDFRFFYREGILLSAETWFRAPPGEDAVKAAFAQVSTDYYRYSRSGSLRAIDRLLYEGEKQSRISFPRLGMDLPPSGEPVNQGIAYTSDFLLDVYNPEGVTVSYSMDSRGRIVSEVWKDEDGAVTGEFINTWSNDRLLSVFWKSQNQERLVEYEYDAGGNRTVERNFRQGVLERIVTSSNGRDTEEIYMNEKLVLRAVWENGMKISEERISRGGEQN